MFHNTVWGHCLISATYMYTVYYSTDSVPEVDEPRTEEARAEVFGVPGARLFLVRDYFP